MYNNNYTGLSSGSSFTITHHFLLEEERLFHKSQYHYKRILQVPRKRE